MYYQHLILFAGHMIDAPGRVVPRFPPSREPLVAEVIERAVAELVTGASSEYWHGVSGATAGSDILFLEACGRLRVPFSIVLFQEVEAHIKTMIEYAGNAWVDRFLQLWAAASEQCCIAADYQDYPLWVMQYPIDKATAIDLMLFYDSTSCGDVWRQVWQEVARSGGQIIILDPHHIV